MFDVIYLLANISSGKMKLLFWANMICLTYIGEACFVLRLPTPTPTVNPFLSVCNSAATTPCYGSTITTCNCVGGTTGTTCTTGYLSCTCASGSWTNPCPYGYNPYGYNPYGYNPYYPYGFPLG